MGNLYRAQILIEQEQHRTLVEMAENQDKSVSQIVREILQRYLQEFERENQLKQEMSALEQLISTRNQLQQQFGFLNEDLLEEVREERQQELELMITDDE
jgi:metal-responsive CopG/Arc/MetJ family transcriptional regulator